MLELPAASIRPETALAAAGMDSLRAAMLQDLIEESFGVEVDLTDVLPEGSILTLTELVRDRRRAPEKGSSRRPLAVPLEAGRLGDPGDPFPLTEVQQAYLAGRSEDLEVGGVGCHVYLEYRRRDFDVQRAKRAWQMVVRRHEMLRAVVTADGQQRILPASVECPLHVDDLAGESDPTTALRATRERMSHQVHDPYTWPLFEIRVSLVSGGEACVHLSFDLLPLDGRSLIRVLGEWGQRYQDLADAGPIEGPSFRDYVIDKQLREAENAEGLAAEARRQAAELPPGPGLPLAIDPTRIRNPRFRRRSAYVEAHAWERLRTKAAARGLTPSALLCAAFGEVLRLYGDRQAFTLTATSFDRPPVGMAAELTGEFTSVLLVPLEPEGEGFEVRARHAGRRLMDALSKRNVQGVRLLREYAQLARSGERPPRPLAPVVFTSLLEDIEGIDWLGEQDHAVSQTPQVWLDHQALLHDGRLLLVWDAIEDLFPPGLLDAMHNTYLHLLHSLCAREDWAVPGRELAGMPTLAKELPGPALGCDTETLHGLVEEQAARTPEAEAVVADDRRLSYRQVVNAARMLAHELAGAGVRPGDVVAVVLPKGWEQVPAVLGTLQAGAAFVPVDPDVPTERLRDLLADSTARCAVTNSRLGRRATWPPEIRLVPVDEVWAVGLDGAPPEPPRGGSRPGDLAYIIYTSGSTGRPKGVAIEHRSAVNTVKDINERFGVGPEDRVLALTPLTFDLSIYDVFGLLSAGGSLVMPSHERRDDPGHWVGLVEREGVSVWNSVPALLQLLIEDPAASARASWAERLRLVLLSGDWIPVEFAAALRRDLLPQARLVSLGGATEASVWSVLYEIDEVSGDWSSVPYGRAMRGQGAHVLDPNLEPRPAWAPGTLYLSGAGLAREYWRDPEKTGASFVSHPITGRRLYRTGDLARLRPDGNLELLGREDAQVKIQGHRIEPGEVETAMVSHPAISGAVVGATGSRDGVRKLVAYVRHAGEASPSPEEVRDHVAQKLPRHLVPDVVRVVERFPLTPNGKVDRGALFARTSTSRPLEEQEEEQDRHPQTGRPETTETILRLVSDIAGATAVTPDARIADLELTSVDLIRLANALEDELGSRPTLDGLYRMRRLGDLLEHYASADAARTSTPGTTSGEAPPAADEKDAPGAVIADPAERGAFKERVRARRVHPGPSLAITLPEPETAAEDREAALRRRSERAFDPEPVDAEALSAWLSCLREHREEERPKRAWPSAGGLYPVRTYLQVSGDGSVKGLARGVYHYDPAGHALKLVDYEPSVRPEDHWPQSRDVARQAAFTLFLVADLEDVAPMYGELAEPFCLIEAGAMSQLLATRAPRFGLGTCPIGAVNFTAAAERLGLGQSQPLLHALVGGRSGAPRSGARPAALAAEPDGRQNGGGSNTGHEAQAAPGPKGRPTPRAVSSRDLLPETELRLPPLPDGEAPADPPGAVLVTGSTGFLGTTVVSELLRRADADVYCLVRAPDAESARRRVLDRLKKHGLGLGPAEAQRVVGVVGDLASPRLGLEPCAYERLSGKVDAVYHSGARVKWLRSYEDLKQINVDGTRRVLDFVVSGRRKRLSYVSTIAVFPFGGSAPLEEDSPLDREGLLYGGYTQSKWVAEKLVRAAADRGVNAVVLRPGTVTGDTRSGAFNPESFLDVLLKGCVELGWAPEVDLPLDMSPVDYVGAATVALSLNAAGAGEAYHLTNPSPAPLTTVYDLIEGLGYKLRREPYDAWRARLLRPGVVEGNALAPFAPFLAGAAEHFLRTPPYDCSRALRDLGDDGPRCPPVDGALIRTYFDAYRSAGFLSPAEVRA